jgi:hypothetical protein
MRHSSNSRIDGHADISTLRSFPDDKLPQQNDRRIAYEAIVPVTVVTLQNDAIDK